MTKEDIKRIIQEEEQNIKLFEEKQQQFQELIDKAKLNIVSAKNVIPEPKNPYERVEKRERYFTLGNISGKVAAMSFQEDKADLDDNIFENGLYFNDETFAQKTAKEIELYLKLKKFTYDNGWSDEVWGNEDICKRSIYQCCNGSLGITGDFSEPVCGVVYFRTQEIAKQAIEKFRELIEEVL